MDFYSFKNFRSINNEEIHLVWEWRNHIDITKWMFNQDLIPFDNHVKFIESLKTDNTKQYWLVQRKNTSIGVTYIVDIEKNSGEWGYYIAPEFHEKNLGVEFYYYTLEYLFNFIEMEKLYGYTLVNNVAANALNDFFGFDKELMVRRINDTAYDVFFRNLAKDKFFDKIKKEPQVLKLLRMLEKR